MIEYAPDAHVLAEAIAARSETLVSLKHKHMVCNPRATVLSFPVGTPGDFLAWFRERVQAKAEQEETMDVVQTL